MPRARRSSPFPRSVALLIALGFGIATGGGGRPGLAQEPRRGAGITEERLRELDRKRVLEELEAREATRRSEREKLARMIATPWESRAEAPMETSEARGVVELVHEGRTLAAVWLFERTDADPARPSGDIASDPASESPLRVMVPPGGSDRIALPRGKWRVRILLGAHGLGSESTAPLEVRIAKREGAVSRLSERDATKIRTKLEDRRREAFRRSVDADAP